MKSLKSMSVAIFLGCAVSTGAFAEQVDVNILTADGRLTAGLDSLVTVVEKESDELVIPFKELAMFSARPYPSGYLISELLNAANLKGVSGGLFGWGEELKQITCAPDGEHPWISGEMSLLGVMVPFRFQSNTMTVGSMDFTVVAQNGISTACWAWANRHDVGIRISKNGGIESEATVNEMCADPKNPRSRSYRPALASPSVNDLVDLVEMVKSFDPNHQNKVLANETLIRELTEERDVLQVAVDEAMAKFQRDHGLSQPIGLENRGGGYELGDIPAGNSASSSQLAQYASELIALVTPLDRVKNEIAAASRSQFEPSRRNVETSGSSIVEHQLVERAATLAYLSGVCRSNSRRVDALERYMINMVPAEGAAVSVSKP